jgi:hypothetical protein
LVLALALVLVLVGAISDMEVVAVVATLHTGTCAAPYYLQFPLLTGDCSSVNSRQLFLTRLPAQNLPTNDFQPQFFPQTTIQPKSAH